MNTNEVLKLALEALEYIYNGANNQGPHTGISWRCVSNKAEPVITALREALAKPDFWEGYEPEPDSTCNNTLRAQGKAYPRTCKKCGFGPCVGLAQQALDKKAENARELGLDYEPVCNKDPQGCWNVRCQLGKKCKNTPAQQEPVGKVTETIGGAFKCEFSKPLQKGALLYTTPPAQQEPVYHLRQYGDVTKEQLDRYMATGDINPQPAQQEPVAWTLLLTGEHNGLVGKAGEKFVGAPEYYKRVDVYTSPPAQQEPVGFAVMQLPWVGLTDEDWTEIENMPDTFDQGVAWAQARLKRNNT